MDVFHSEVITIPEEFFYIPEQYFYLLGEAYIGRERTGVISVCGIDADVEGAELRTLATIPFTYRLVSPEEVEIVA